MADRDISMTRVLCVGDDASLLSTRELILKRAGYQVCTTPDWEITDQTDFSSFDAVLFCHSVPRDRAERISFMAHLRNPRALTILLTHSECGEVSGFDLACAVGSGPGQLLEALEKVCTPKRFAA